MAPDDDKTRTHVTLTAGTMVSHYRIIEKIGAGGMGEVYLAEDTELNRKVALKFLPAHLCHDADCRARFKREAQAAAKLDHPNIVAVHEVGEFQGRPFFAMQHVEGQSLKEVLAGKALPLDRIVEVGIQICDGLQAAHEKGIAHRDIKPSNILIDSHGRARIVDFGLASVKGTGQLTKTGSTLGTIGYMSPEQVRGDRVDHRSDLFSFGVVLYEMLTGHSPFLAESEAAALHAITSAKPDLLARFRREVPADLQTVVDKALEKNVATRYQHADDIVTDLKRLSAGVIEPRTPRRDLWNRYVVTAAALVLLIVVGYWSLGKFLTEGRQMPESTRKMVAVLPFENLGLPEDEYFADGITDEIIGKLATIRELGVISRTSTMQYKKTTKNLKQIAKELSVDYILEGSIRWDKGGDTSRVRILPQLIRVSDDTHLWVETFQQPLDDIFAVQADIGNSIATALSVTLSEADRAHMALVPTSNMDAYQAYLRGMDYYRAPDFPWTNAPYAVEMLERAVTLDSTFALAYAQLAGVYASLYRLGWEGYADPLARAKAAADRALALQPGLPAAHLSLSLYYLWGHRDAEQALREIGLAESGLPNAPDILKARATVFVQNGQFKAAIELREQQLKLSPRDAELAKAIANVCRFIRDYASSERYFDQSIILEPNQLQSYLDKAWLYYSWRADTAMARRTIESAPRQDYSDTHLAWYQLYFLERRFTKALNHVAQIGPDGAVDDAFFTTLPEMTGEIFALMNQPIRARASFDSARTILEEKLKEHSDDHRIHSSLGIVYAYLGRVDDALREGKRGVELVPVSKDAVIGPVKVEGLMRIYTLIGEYNAAFDQIDYLLSIPSSLSIAWIRLDPRFDPLRNLPRYQKLLATYDA